MKECMAPILKERREQMAVNPKHDVPSDTLSWTIKETQGEALDPEIQVEYQVGIGKPDISVSKGLFTCLY